MQFTLRKYDGQIHSFWQAVESPVPQLQATAQPGHHIIDIDRSGSMYGSIDDAKVMIEKLLTLEEFHTPEMLVSLISYSSHGDVKLHFSRVPVAEIVQAGSSFLKELRSIRATAMTCISQSLKLAESLVREGELTCISLHTDGYANDYSPTTERRDVDLYVQALQKHPGVFVNTIGYSDYCDFQFLASISNKLSGSTIRAKNAKQVYEGLHAGFSQLAGKTVPTIEIPTEGADFVVYVSNADKKILGSRNALTVRGASPEGARILRFYKVTGTTSDAQDIDMKALCAFIKASLSEGLINQAKFALCSTRNKKFTLDNYRALTNPDLAAFAEACEFRVFNTVLDEVCNYGVPGFGGSSVLDFLDILEANKDSIRINLPDLQSIYKRRGLKRVAGIRKEDGSLEEPTLKTEPVGTDEWVSVTSVDVNRSSPTANITIAQAIELVNRKTGKPIHEVAGIPLKLSDFRAYTIVGDGAVNASHLMVKVSNKRAWACLAKAGFVPVDGFDPNAPVKIALSEFPVVGDKAAQLPSGNDVRELFRMTARQKLLKATLKGSSTEYTAEQIAELKAHYLSPSLYVSFPTTNTYVKLEDAIANGEVDARTSFEVVVGTVELTAASKMKSGNAFFDARYVMKRGGGPVKATLDGIWDADVSVEKGPPKKGKPNAADDIMDKEFASFFDKEYVALKAMSADDRVLALNEELRQIGNWIDSCYAGFRDLVFQVGATGLVPDGVAVMNAEELAQKYPALALSKEEKEGTFFEVPDGGLVSVFASSAYFTVEK
jgi:hypothetical protein